VSHYTLDPEEPHWPDDKLDERLVYIVRWDEVSWMPSYPAGTDSRRRRPAVGSRTALIDAATGTFLGTHMSGTSPVDDAEDAGTSQDVATQQDLAKVWADRSYMDARFVVKAGSVSRWWRREIFQAVAGLESAAVAERLSEIGTDFARRLRALDQAVGPGIGPTELADVHAALEAMLDAAESAASQPLPPQARQLHTHAVRDVLTIE